MHGTWHILSGAWSAVVIFYCVLYLAVSGRLRGGEVKRRTNMLFWLVVSLAAIREFVWFAFGRGLIYRLAVLFGGIAAGVAALVLIATLITQKAGDGNADDGGDEQIQLLKLN